MKALVIGAGGLIGSALVQVLERSGYLALGLNRTQYELVEAAHDKETPAIEFNIVYWCAAKSRFMDCEADPTAYTVNVDAPIWFARQTPAKFIFLSSDAVERALHTNYGMHKALAEIGLRAVCDPVIARICSKVTKDSGTLPSLCDWLVGLVKAPPGVHRWVAR